MKKATKLCALCSLLCCIVLLVVSGMVYSQVKTAAQKTDGARLAIARTLSVTPQPFDNSLSDLADTLAGYSVQSLVSEKPDVFASCESTATLCDDVIAANLQVYEEEQRINSIRSEISSRSGMVGRLIVPGAGIDVALISVSANSGTAAMQSVCNASDSCAYITDAISGAVLLADHNNQGFAGLTRITSGMTGEIVTSDQIIGIVATTVTNGHNNGMICDSNYNQIGAIAPYIAYTCLDSWQNVRIVGFSAK